MAPMLVSIKWPGLTYLLRGGLEKCEHNGQKWNCFGETRLTVSRTLLLSSTQIGGDCWSLCWGLVETGTPNSLWDYQPGVSSYCWVYGGDVSADYVCLHVYTEKRGQSVGNITWWSLTVGSHGVTFGDVFGNHRQVMKLSRSRREVYSLDINNTESSYSPNWPWTFPL